MHPSPSLPVRLPIPAPAPIRRPGQDRPCLLARWISLLLLLVSYHAAHGATLVAEDSEWRYFKGFTEASTPDTTAWRRSDFNDTTWSKGLGPFYYEDDTGYSGHTSLSDMRRNSSSVCLRNVFKLTNAASVQ